ncbi:MAG: heme ABC transporter permease [Gammaproteobacteria bacterium]|jgi:heme exporter protein C|nr:heme ABC transporter permease [Gammaproteobacteria bacterium]MBT3724593.1 heme ABC transporter permease [Gammaproteobacteria bacterium]MBT4077986.1 heme ABC transporter permease [Gammaproteobacteria bacterium]MBT4194392.1 heme ABC transporter permease [Gammaproteobacteria bacterium]MBT4450748.1 heme ABC transporter permease [Gammaproteobacteria bacterium]
MFDWFVKWFHRMGSPPHFYRFAGRWLPWLTALFTILIIGGLYGGLILAPTDYQQGESYRIIFVHVPAAWMSMFIYMVMAACGVIILVWRMKLAEIVLSCSAPIGASFTFLALVTGSLWGKPMWGTYWVWDARLTAELILLFLYLGIMGLYGAIDDKRVAGRAVAILAIVGMVNIPIIHYSVEWWNSLHQGPTVTKFDKPSIVWSMLWPLLVMALAFKVYFVISLFQRVRAEILHRERNTRWVEELVKS